MTTSRYAGILREAVRLLDERGWTQHLYVSARGRVCGTGAICAARAGEPHLTLVRGDALIDCLEILRLLDEEVANGKAFECWNDVPGRTADEVKAVLISAAARAEERSGITLQGVIGPDREAQLGAANPRPAIRTRATIRRPAAPDTRN